jgi:hypothetical protein
MNTSQTDPQAQGIARRRFPRVAVDLRTEYQILPPKLAGRSSAGTHDAAARTLGGGGLMFSTPDPLPVGTKLDMTLHYLSVSVEFVVEVVWIKEASDEKGRIFLCGSRFSAISYDNLTHIRHILNSHRIH